MATQVRKKRKFSNDFKCQAVEKIESGKLSSTAACRKWNLSPNLIKQWREKQREGRLVDGPTKREKQLEKELERYKVLLAEAHAEKELLKKFHDYVRRQKKLDSAVITGQNLDNATKMEEHGAAKGLPRRRSM